MKEKGVKSYTSVLDSHGDEIFTAILIRKAEEELLKLFDKGKLFGTVHTAIGQEFSAVSVVRNVDKGDYVFSNHRCHGHFIAYSQNTKGLIAEVMGKRSGICAGRGGSQHLAFENFLSNGVQAGSSPIAAGVALAKKINNESGLSVVFIGDGTLGQGLLYEVMNICSIWSLPVLFVCEKNNYAQSTETCKTIAGSILARPESFSIKTCHSNTWNWRELIIESQESFDYVRSNSRPFFHLIDTYRLKAHSKGDDFRDPDEIKSFEKKDPLNAIIEQNFDESQLVYFIEKAQNIISDAVKLADHDEFDTLLTSKSNKTQETLWLEHEFDSKKIVDSVNAGLRYGLESCNVVLLGEDIESPYGGAFKCTKGLSEKYPDRVLNTPISEPAVVGIGTGLALEGFISVVEIMFADFLTLGFDQWINHAAKFRWMYNNQFNVPLVIRAPAGGNRGYGPTHSQSIEKHFLGIPDTQVLCLNHRYNPEVLYQDLFDSIETPTLVIENKVLYGKYSKPEVIPGFSVIKTSKKFPTINIKPNIDPDITIVAIGGISVEVESTLSSLLIDEEIICDLFMPTQLYPFDIQCLLASIKCTNRLLIVDEGQSFVSIASEIVALVSEIDATIIKKFGRVAPSPCPIPSSRPLEEFCLPQAKDIYDAVIRLNQ